MGGVISAVIALIALGALVYLKARKFHHTQTGGTPVFEGTAVDTATEPMGMATAQNQVMRAAERTRHEVTWKGINQGRDPVILGVKSKWIDLMNAKEAMSNSALRTLQEGPAE